MASSGESDLLEKCVDALASLPGIRILKIETENANPGIRFDRIVTANVRGQKVQIFIEAKSTGFPRDVDRVSVQFEGFLRDKKPSGVGMFVAPFITESSREMLKAKCINYWDQSGSLFLRTESALYDVERPVNRVRRPVPKRIFRGSASQVIHALLNEPNRIWRISELAKQSEVANSHVHEVLRALEVEGFVERSGRGPNTRRKLIQPGNLLDEWANVHSLDEYDISSFYIWRQPTEQVAVLVTRELESRNISYALTAVSGAIRRAPFVWRESVAAILVPRSTDVMNAFSAPEISQVDEGENLSLLATKEMTPFMFRTLVDGNWVASDIQIYLDLMVWPQRGKEQADYLRRERIGF